MKREEGTRGGARENGEGAERTDAAMKVMELVYCEMAPGDAVYFHSNTLHGSDQNKSPHPRWSLLCCYNTRHNNPYKASHHPFYEKLEKAADSALKEMGMKLFADKTEFWNPVQDQTVGAGKS